MCNCEGYIERPSTVVFVMSMIGLVVICVFGRETGLSSDRNRSNRSNRNNNGRVSLQVRNLKRQEEITTMGVFVQMTMRMNLERQASYKEEIRTHLPPSPLASRSNKKNKEMNNRQIIRIRSRARVGDINDTKSKPSSRRHRGVLLQRRDWFGVGYVSNLDARRARIKRRTKRSFLWIILLQQRHRPILFRSTLGPKHAPRKPIRWGLIGGGLSLIIASWARVGGITYPGLLHFGATTLGLSTGAVYPVLAPAALDHSRWPRAKNLPR